MECQSRCHFSGDSGGRGLLLGSWGGCHSKCKVLEVLWHSSLGRGRNGGCGRCGLYFFLKEARKSMWAPAESRSKESNSALRGMWRGKYPPGLDGCLRWPQSVRERAGTPARAHARMHTAHSPAPPSAESGRDHLATSLLSISVCSLLDDVRETPKCAGSAGEPGRLPGGGTGSVGRRSPKSLSSESHTP